MSLLLPHQLKLQVYSTIIKQLYIEKGCFKHLGIQSTTPVKTHSGTAVQSVSDTIKMNKANCGTSDITGSVKNKKENNFKCIRTKVATT